MIHTPGEFFRGARKRSGGCAQVTAPPHPQTIGKIQAATGPVTVMDASGAVAQVKVGDPVYRHDTIETGPDGAVGITFTDGTAFNLSNNARMALNEFVCDGTSNSALFSLSKGVFAFIAGKVAKTGGLRIDTPFARIRGAAQDGGIGILTLAALAFSTIREIQAASRSDAFLDDGTITYKDSPHGTFEITTKDGRVIVADDPGETIVVDPAGSVTRLPNSSSRMAELQGAQQAALATLSMGLGQQGAAPGGSSTPTFNIPLQLQPINFSQPQNHDPAPLTITINATPGNQGVIDIPAFKPPPVPPVMPPNPVLAVDVSGAPAIIEFLNTTGSTKLDTVPSGTLTFTDFNVSSVSASLASITWSGGATLPSGLSTVLASALTTSESTDSSTASSGSIVTTFSAADNNFDFLAAGETLTITYNVTVTDNNGAGLTQPVTIIVTGSNDAPVLAADASGPHTTTQAVNTSGTLIFTDVDLSDHHTVSTSVTSAIWSGGATLPSGLAAVLAGALSTTTADSTGSGSGSIAFTFGAGDALDFLAAGQTLTITYNVTVTDNNGVSSTQPVTITVTGTNDAPVAVADVAAVKEDTPPNPVSGNLLANDTDVDSGDTHTVSAVAGAIDNGTTITTVGIYGTLVVTKATGAYTYTLANGQANVQALAEGQQVTDVFTYTNSDNHGGSSSSTLTVTVTGTNDAPVITSGAAVARVSEEGLPNGVPDTLPAGLDTTNSTSASGTITATDVDGDALTMSLGTPSASLTSGGVAIAWTLQDAHTLVGKAGATTIITATITDAGAYNVTLSGPIDHPVANQEDIKTFTVPVTVSDGHTTTPTTLSVTIEDDSPKAEPVEVSVVPTDSKTNVMLILDLSGSMDSSSGLTGLTRLDVAKAAINELLDQYDNRGDVMVRIVTFSDTGVAVGSTWQSVADAKAAIAGLSAGGSTNYDAALLTAMGAFTDGTKLTGPGTQNVSYFLSDGDPTASSDWPQIPGTQLANGIQANEQAVWESFLTTNKIVSFALGIPNVGTPANLDPIAFDPASGTQLADTPIIVTDLSQLANALVFTIPPVTGSVLAGAGGATSNSFGADGGFVQSITVDGVTYTFNPAANGGAGGITTSGGGSFTYDGTTKTLTVDTDTSVVGGELAMVMTTGAFTFQPPARFSSETVGFVLVDRDGDTANSTIHFSAAGGPDHPPIVRDDHVITNISGGSGTNIVIPDYALLYNDSDADGQTIAITGAITNVLGANSVTHASGNVTFTDNNTNGGSFTYTGSTTSPAASDTGDVTIDRSQTGTTLTGTGFGEILIGRDGTNNTINANEGNDVLIGGTGNDTLNGGAGADMMTGGGGVDTFIVNSAQSPGTVGGSGDAGTISGYDVITDFATATDILNLQGTAAAATGTNVNGTDSSLTINGQTIKSHTVSNGIVTFDDANSFGSALTLSSTANVAAAVDYLHRNDLGSAGATVAFVANIGGTAHTYIFEQFGESPSATNDILVDLVGVTLSNLSTLIPSHILPAGVAGSPINLGLTDPADHAGPVTVIIAGVPSGWTLNEGADNGDGSWTIQAGNVSTLSITSPDNHAGAMVFPVTMSWANADGSSGFARATDNVEVFAQGAPIFAWSGDDHLTGSSGKDLFVFSQPIGDDTIYRFDASGDRIDLIGYTGFANFDDVQRHLAQDNAGNAVITLADGQTITLNGVASASLGASNFVFDQVPVTNNAGTMSISDGAVLPLSGIVNNTGMIALDSIANDSHLELIQHGITLQGGGQVMLSDSGENFISGTIPSVTLTNLDNTISGAGQLGAGQMTLVNDGTIVAAGSHALVIDTGANVVTNIGTLEATGSGGLIVNSDVANSGLIWAHGGNITINGAVTGSGSAMIDGTATLGFGAASSVDITFAANAAGMLTLKDAADFTGTISGFSSNDQIDLTNISYSIASAYNAAYSSSTNITTLVITDGTSTGTIKLVGDYTTNTAWHFSVDGHGGTLVTDSLPGGGADLAQTVTAALTAQDGTADEFPFQTDSQSGTLAGDSTLTTSSASATDTATLDPSSSASSDHQSTAPTTTAADTGPASNVTTNSQPPTADTTSTSTQAGATTQMASAAPPATGTNGDTFVFAANFGHETITNFHPDTDVIEIDHTVFADFQALLAATHDDGNGNAVIAANPNETITVENFTVAQLVQHQSDFHFT